MASIEITTPEGVRHILLQRESMILGRLASSDIPLPYAHISRQHAQINHVAGEWWITDLGSTNGLHISGVRIARTKLDPGVAVALSPQVSLTFQQESSTPVPPVVEQHAQSEPPVTPLAAYAPKSPYASDESPYYPRMQSSNAAQSQPSTQPASGAQPRQVNANAPFTRAVKHATSEEGRQQMAAPDGGVPKDVVDPAVQDARILEQRRKTAGPPSSVLHVCQTCGQLTASDGVYCQYCHHSIASECPRCRFSLLPVQDMCPRCQTPNPSSARRARRNAGQRAY